jgi:flagellar biosynthesis protein FlhF
VEDEMKIKRYTADSMRAALAQVRAEQGPDAVILSSRRGEEGIEVIAAVDYDEGLFAAATRQRVMEPVIAPEPAAPTRPLMPIAARPAAPIAARAAAPVPATTTAPLRSAAPAPTRSAASAPAASSARAPAAAPVPARLAAKAAAPKPAPAVAMTDPAYGAVQRELQDLRQLLETRLAGVTWNEKRLHEPLKARILEELSAMDIAPDVALTLANLAPRRTNLQNPSHIPLALLVKHLPVVEDFASVSGGLIAVVGPTGAGKTTTIAKIAARWCMRHGSEDLALVSTDGYRIGARDQLMTYARILGAPMHAANNGKELARVLDRLSAKKLILIDTAGMGPRDVRLTEQLATLKYGAPRSRVLLALPAQAEGQSLDETVCAYIRVKPAACILTKVDEAASLGAAISTTLRHKLKIAYVCDGQRVPEDLHAGHQKKVWLVRAALKPKDPNAPARDDTYFARNFGQVPAHA